MVARLGVLEPYFDASNLISALAEASPAGGRT